MSEDSEHVPVAPQFEVRELMQTEPRPLSAHPAMVYLAGLSAGSRRTMFKALDTIAVFLSGGQLTVFDLDWSALRYRHTAAIRAFLAERYSPATANKMLSALRQVLFHAWKMDYLSTEDYEQARLVANIKGESSRVGRDLELDEIAALLAVCEADCSPAGARDAAIIALLYATGIQRAGLVRLTIDDYDVRAQSLRVRDAASRRAYVVYLFQNGAQRALADWLALRGTAPGALFWPVNKAGKIANRSLSTQAVYNMLLKRAHQAGIDHVSPLDFRRALAGDLLDAGADMATVREILGHTRAGPARSLCSDDIKRRAANQIQVPYQGYRPVSPDET